MEWMNRSAGGAPTTNQPANPGAGVTSSRRSNKSGIFKGLRVASVALLFSITVLILALVALAVVGTGASEGKYVSKKQMQAVFLNGGQVYFGHITNLNEKYLRIADIYYLRVNQQVQPNQQGSSTPSQNDISLVKLGCELHGPQDSMVVNQSQVIFWENLKDDGQVAKAVSDYKKQNPGAQKCDTTSQSNTNSNTNTTTPTPTNTTTPTTTTPKKP
jgi:hypothetical protein